MSDNISIAKIDVDTSGVTKGAEDIVQAGVIAEKGFEQMAAGADKVVKASKQVQAEAGKEVAVVANAEKQKTTARQKASLAKIQLATVEAKAVEAQAKADLVQVEQAEKRKTQLSDTRAKQRVINTKTASSQELLILNSSLRAEEMMRKQALAIELINIKADVRAVQDAEKEKQAAQKQTHDKQMALLKQQTQASRGGIGGGRGPNFQGAQTGGLGGGGGGGMIGGGGITPPPPPPPPSGGGIGNALTQVGAGLGGVAGGVAGLAGSIMTANIPGIISNLINLGKASIDAGKAIFAAGVAAEHAAVDYQRQVAAAINLAGSQRDLQKIMDAYVEASGGAIDQAEALTNVIQLQALGFAKNADQTKEFVTAARGISLAMGKTVDDVTNEIALAIGNLSTRRLDQLGLSIDEVTKRTNELQKANVGMGRQMAFEQAILEAATKKFGALAESAIGQKSAVERMEADWKNLALTFNSLVAPAVDKVADLFDRLIKSATDSTLIQAIKNIENQPLDKSKDTTKPDLNLPALGTADTEEKIRKLRDSIELLEKSKTSIFQLSQKATQDAIDKSRKELSQYEDDLARLNARNMLSESKLPGGRPLPYMTDPARSAPSGDTRTALKKFEDENLDIIVEHHQKETAITTKSINEQLSADADYHQAVEKSNTAFNQQMEEQAADHDRQMAREEEDYQNEVAKIKRDAAEQAAKAERDLGQQIDKERRDAGQEQQRWLRDYNESVGRNNRDEKEQEGKVTREYNEQKTKDDNDYNKKIKDINDKFNDDNTKARKDHYDNLLDAAGHLDAVAVYNEQRRFAKENEERQKNHTKDLDEARKAHDDQATENKSAYDEQISDMQNANNQRNSDEKAAYDQRVSDAKTALDQQILDQQNALAQQLLDASTADAQRLTDMGTAHENQKNQEILDYGLQLEREKTHHNNELTELDTQHSNRITQIKQQQFEEQQTLEKEWEKQAAAQGIAAANYVNQQQALQEASLAIFEAWWKKQNEVMLGVVPAPTTDNSLFQPIIESLKGYGAKLKTQLGTAVTRMDTPEINRLTELLGQIETALNQYGETLDNVVPASVSTDKVIVKTDDPVVSISSTTGGATQTQGVSNVTMGDITIYLGDVGNRTDSEVKQMVGEAMTYWVTEASKSQSGSRW